MSPSSKPPRRDSGSAAGTRVTHSRRGFQGRGRKEQASREGKEPMSQDLSGMLREWPYEPGQLSVRVIDGDDGRPKIQMRLDLGMIQMEMEGRPDGQRPMGAESLLEHYETLFDEHAAAGEALEGPPGPEGAAPEDAEEAVEEAPTLDADACRALREEAAQYYHRYVALFILEDYEGVVRDTSRNLRVLDLCAQRAESEEDRLVLEQFRPYILMMRARAVASQAVRDREPKAGILALDDALERIKGHFAEIGEPDAFERSGEVQLLRGMRDALAPKLPVSARSELRDRLRKAVEQENYELAAILRDELKMMPE